jgi:hypothetical protein
MVTQSIHAWTRAALLCIAVFFFEVIGNAAEAWACDYLALSDPLLRGGVVKANAQRLEEAKILRVQFEFRFTVCEYGRGFVISLIPSVEAYGSFKDQKHVVPFTFDLADYLGDLLRIRERLVDSFPEFFH